MKKLTSYLILKSNSPYQEYRLVSIQNGGPELGMRRARDGNCVHHPPQCNTEEERARFSTHLIGINIYFHNREISLTSFIKLRVHIFDMAAFSAENTAEKDLKFLSSIR